VLVVSRTAQRESAVIERAVCLVDASLLVPFEKEQVNYRFPTRAPGRGPRANEVLIGRVQAWGTGVYKNLPNSYLETETKSSQWNEDTTLSFSAVARYKKKPPIRMS